MSWLNYLGVTAAGKGVEGGASLCLSLLLCEVGMKVIAHGAVVNSGLGKLGKGLEPREHS